MGTSRYDWGYYPDWREEVLNLNQTTGGIAVKLYSFEIKKELSFSNLREAFFQAVSNSSWPKALGTSFDHLSASSGHQLSRVSLLIAMC